jgi:uncharacterized protein with GYD domain
MAKYLISVNYSLDGIKGLRTDGGTKRRTVVQHALESVGGKLDAFYFCLGDRDAVVIADLPDAASAAGLSVAVSAAGGARCSVTALLTPEEMDRAVSKETAYKAPGH